MNTEQNPTAKKLATLGSPTMPGADAWSTDYLSLGITSSDIPALVDCAARGGTLDGNDRASWAPLQAWRALAQLGAAEAMPAVLNAYMKAAGTDDAEWRVDDIYEVARRLGEAAFEPLADFFTNRSLAPESRQWLGEAFARLGQSSPQLRVRCNAVLRSALVRYREQSNLFNAIIINDLAILKAIDTAPLIEEVYRNGRADLSFCGDWEDVQVELGLIPARLTALSKDDRIARRLATEWNSYDAPVNQLLALGRPAPRRGIDEYDYRALGITLDHVADLIRMVCDERLYQRDDAAAYAPIHAWRSLAQLGAADAIEPLLSQMYRFDVDGFDWISEEYPAVFAKIGVAAMPHLERFLTDTTRGPFSRMCIMGTLEHFAKSHPELRDRVVACAAHLLAGAGSDNPQIVADSIWALADMGAIEYAPMMEQAFADGYVDHSVCGDWEDIQIKLGLRASRTIPRTSMMDRFAAEQAARGEQLPHQSPPAKSSKSHASAKAKRKQQKKSRKKNRR